MLQESVQSLKMLYCYAPEDKQWLEEIDLRLSNLKRSCHIISQFNGELLLNSERKEQLITQLSDTDLALLLVSPHFQKVEVFWNEISHEAWAVRWLGGCRVVVLLLQPIPWVNAPFATREILPLDIDLLADFRKPEPVAHIEVFPHEVKPLTEWQSQEQAWQNIQRGMRVAIEKQWLARGNYLRDEGGGALDEEAIAAYTEALRLNPSLSRAWYGKARIFLGWKNYNGALQACDEAIRLDPTFAWIWYMKGNALAGLNRSREALNAYDEALRLDPTFHLVWVAKGSVFARLELFEEAIHAYDEVLLLNPTSAWAWHEKSMLLKVMKRKREARKAQKKARQFGWRS